MQLFILKNSYPKNVIIKNSNGNEERTYKNFNEFKSDLPFLLALSKTNHVLLELDFRKSRPIAASNIYLILFNQRYTNLSSYSSVNFYDYDENNDLVKFDDLFLEFLLKKTYINAFDNTKKIALDWVSNMESERKNIAFMGEQLIQLTLSKLFYDDSSAIIDIQEITKEFMTDEHYQLIFDYYNLYRFIKNRNQVIDINYMKETINALIYAYFKENNSFDNLENVLRFFINLINPNLLDFTLEKEAYSDLAQYLLVAYNEGKEEVTFKEIEQYSNHKLDAKLLMGIYLLEDYGFRFIKFDFTQKITKFKLFCN